MNPTKCAQNINPQITKRLHSQASVSLNSHVKSKDADSRGMSAISQHCILLKLVPDESREYSSGCVMVPKDYFMLRCTRTANNVIAAAAFGTRVTGLCWRRAHHGVLQNILFHVP